MFKLAAFLTLSLPVLLITGGAAPDIAMSLVAVLFLIHSFAEKDWRWCRRRWIQCLAVLWVYMIARSCFVPTPSESLRHSAPFVRYFLFAAATGYWTLHNALTRQWFFRILTFAVLFMAADGLLQSLTGRDILLIDIFRQPDGNLRLTGPFHKPILGIMLAWLSFPVCLSLLISPEGTLHKGRTLAAGIISTLLVIAVIALSGERMALLLTLFGWAIAIVLLRGHRRVLMGAFVSMLIVLGGIFAVSPMMAHRQTQSTAHIITNWWDSPYGMLLKSDLQAAEINPVFGVGSNYFHIVCPALYPQMDVKALEAVCNTHPHNIYMEWLIENGIIGLALFLGFLGFLARECYVSWSITGRNSLFVGCIIAFILRVWPIASSTGFFSRWGSPPFWLVLGALLVYTLREEQKSC